MLGFEPRKRDPKSPVIPFHHKGKEEVGFEPTVDTECLRRFSRPVPLTTQPFFHQWTEGDSNPQPPPCKDGVPPVELSALLIREAGLEPASRKAADFKSAVYASSTTLSHGVGGICTPVQIYFKIRYLRNLFPVRYSTWAGTPLCSF